MATLDAKGRSLGSYCQGNWCRWNAQTEKKESAWFWPLNWKSEWQTLTLWLYSLIKVSLFWPYYGSLKGFQSNPCRLAATKSADAFDVQGTVFSMCKTNLFVLRKCSKRWPRLQKPPLHPGSQQPASLWTAGLSYPLTASSGCVWGHQGWWLARHLPQVS